MDTRHAKEELRRSIQERLRGEGTSLIAESRSISRRLIEALPPKPVTVAAFMPMATEPDIRPFLEHLLTYDYPLYLPRAEGKSFVFRLVADLSVLQKGQFGVEEPLAEAPFLDAQELKIAIIPGRAFDRQGHRLGRGNGGYDVWIKAQRDANPETSFWGVAYECQIIDNIPTEPHDESVDAVMIARGLIPCKNEKKE